MADDLKGIECPDTITKKAALANRLQRLMLERARRVNEINTAHQQVLAMTNNLQEAEKLHEDAVDNLRECEYIASLLQAELDRLNG